MVFEYLDGDHDGELSSRDILSGFERASKFFYEKDLERICRQLNVDISDNIPYQSSPHRSFSRVPDGQLR